MAVYPGTKRIGYAVLDDATVLDAQIKNFPLQESMKSSLGKGKRFLARLFEKFEPNVIVIEENSRRSEQVQDLTNEVKRRARCLHIPVHSYTRRDVKKTIAGNEKASKRKIAEIVVGRYPWYKREFLTLHPIKGGYQESKFEALSFAVTEFERSKHY